MAVKTFQLNTIGRVLIVAAAVVCVFAAFIFVRWGFGRTIAQNTNSKEVAEYASELAPTDSETYYRLAILNEKGFIANDQPQALISFEKAEQTYHVLFQTSVYSHHVKHAGNFQLHHE